MSSTLAEFREKFRVAECSIFSNRSWTWSVRPAHPTLGSGILSLNRFATAFGDITAQESADLAVAVATIERALGATFENDKINYLMLMMVDAHVHFHVIPRYSKPRDAFGIAWEDQGWPALPDLKHEQSGGRDEVLHAVRDALRAASG